MSSFAPFLLVAAMSAAFGAAAMPEARTAPVPAARSTDIAQLRAAAGRASSVEGAVLVLAAR